LRLGWIFLLSFFITYWAGINVSSAQKKKVKSMGSLTLNDSLSTYSQSDLFAFPNVDKVSYYQNNRKLREIQTLENDRDWESLIVVLREYVSNFGIVNFYRDTELLWRLATLTEQYGNRNEALLLYKLVLKHHREDIDIASIRAHYDSITVNEKDYFVPLKYYYELVDYRQEVDTLLPPRSVLLNMGAEVNSEQSDYAPALSKNDQTLIFTSKRNADFRRVDPVLHEDLYMSRRDGEFWNYAEAMDDINTAYNEGSACLSKDGRTIYFARCNSPDSYGDCDIFMSTMKEDSTWNKAQNLGVNINSVAWDSHPSLSHGEDTLYFASDRIGGFGLSDIYYSVRTDDGWGSAKNLGPIINTRGSDVSPFYHHLEDVLYFSSNGQNLNFGEFDIYKAYYAGPNWMEPLNIGPLVNGPGSEFYFTIDSRSNDLYYARSVSDRMSNLDLYSFPLPMGAQPLANTKITGSLLNEESGEPFKGIVSIIDLDKGNEVAPKFLKQDGSFEFDLINQRNYLLVLQGDDFFRIEEVFYLDGPMELKTVTHPLASRMKFESIEFDVGKAELKTEMYADLNKVVNFLYDNPEFKLRISGHTDSVGNPEKNLQLSKERAQNIRDYIVIFAGIIEERVEAEGYGDTKPIVENELTEADRKLNRRVEFEIYREAPPTEESAEATNDF